MDQKEVKNTLAIVRQRKEEAARKMAIAINQAMNDFVDETGLEIIGVQVGLERLEAIGSQPKVIVSGVGIDLGL